jgi:hypothetical protein
MFRKTRRRSGAVRLLALAAASAILVSMGCAVPASAADSADLHERVATWDAAAARLGTAGSLWEPVRDLGLAHATA